MGRQPIIAAAENENLTVRNGDDQVPQLKFYR